MKDKLILPAFLALFAVAGFFLVFNYRLALMFGYYTLLINGFFIACFIVLFWWLKTQERTK